VVLVSVTVRAYGKGNWRVYDEFTRKLLGTVQSQAVTHPAKKTVYVAFTVRGARVGQSDLLRPAAARLKR
jgi:hypothetical protein